MIVPAMAPATPPITAPLFVLARSSTVCANVGRAAMSTVNSVAMYFFIFLLLGCLGRPQISQPRCHHANNSILASLFRAGASAVAVYDLRMSSGRSLAVTLHKMLQDS